MRARVCVRVSNDAKVDEDDHDHDHDDDDDDDDVSAVDSSLFDIVRAVMTDARPRGRDDDLCKRRIFRGKCSLQQNE